MALLVLITQLALALGNAEPVTFALLGQLEPTAAYSIAFALLVVGTAMRSASDWLTAKTVAQANCEMRRTVVGAYMHADWSVQATQNTGEFISLLSNNTMKSVDLMKQLIVGFGALLSIAVYLLFGLLISTITVGLIVGIALMSALALYPLGRHARRSAGLSTTRNRLFTQTVMEVSQNALEIKAARAEPQLMSHVDRRVRSLEGPLRMSIFLRRSASSIQLQILLASVLVGLLLAHAIGDLNLGVVASVVLITTRAVQQIRPLQTALHAVQDVAPHLRDLVQATRSYRICRPWPGHTPIGRIERLDCEGLDFSADASPILQDVSLHLHRGQSTAIVGPSGSGKTTLAKVLIGALQAQRGQVLLNGEPIETWDREDFHSRIGFVPQESRLFNASLRDNVSLFSPDAADEDVIAALQAAHLNDWFASLERGLDAMIGERRSRNLSGGQQQRLMIARALFRRPDVLILDEPTSALDPASERHINQLIVEYAAAAIVVVIAHRPTTAQACDQLVVLERGRVRYAGDTEQALKIAEIRGRVLHG